MSDSKNDKEAKDSAPEELIKVSIKTNVQDAVSRAQKTLETLDHVSFSGLNLGINKVLLISEVFKIKVPNMHQYNKLETLTTQTLEGGKVEEPKEGERQKNYVRLLITFYKTKQSKAPENSFHQEPYTEEQAKQLKDFKPPERPEGQGRGGRGGFFRGGRGRGRDHDFRGGFHGGRGRGRDHEFRGGRGRGGFGNRDSERRGGFRGRGRGGKDDRGERREDKEDNKRGRGGRGRGRGRGGNKPESESGIVGL